MQRFFELVLALVCLCCAGLLLAQTSSPQIPYDSVPNLLRLPKDTYLGEAAGVATNSKGHIFVYTRTGSNNVTVGTSRTFVRGFARLFEFDQTGEYLGEIGQDTYGFVFAHAVRVDSQDNIWVVDEGSNLVIKFNPQGRVMLLLGRKPESYRPARGPTPYDFNRPADVGWDVAGNIFVADGHGNSRIVKYDKNGLFIKSWGSKGAAAGQFSTPHTIATDSSGNVYVGDPGNKRIQVFDNDGNFRTQYTNVGAPWAICITPGPHQYLYSSNSNSAGTLDDGEIYKMELNGRILGKFGGAGKLIKEFGSVNEIDCRNPNEILVGEITNWRVQKLILHLGQTK